jgi:hypothetical protein
MEYQHSRVTRGGVSNSSPSGGRLLALHSGNALLDSFGFLLQVFKVQLKLGDLFLFGPEAPLKVVVLTTTARIAVMVSTAASAAVVASTMTAVMTSVFATHDITSF